MNAERARVLWKSNGEIFFSLTNTITNEKKSHIYILEKFIQNLIQSQWIYPYHCIMCCLMYLCYFESKKNSMPSLGQLLFFVWINVRKKWKICWCMCRWFLSMCIADSLLNRPKIIIEFFEWRISLNAFYVSYHPFISTSIQSLNFSKLQNEIRWKIYIQLNHMFWCKNFA